MEDAMIINKGSLERGFAHGQVYKTEVRLQEPNVNNGAFLIVSVFEALHRVVHYHFNHLNHTFCRLCCWNST